jgi:murein DD-endopeptidase
VRPAGFIQSPARKPARGFLDFVAAMLCLWAAAYHTPAGALVRGIVARVTSSHTNAKPLLSYYSGGIYDASPAVVETPVFHPPPGDALGRGVFAAATNVAPAERQNVDALASRYGLPFANPKDASTLIIRAQQDLDGSEDAAVLALFAGIDVARHALTRSGSPRLEFMATQLPPTSQPAIDAASTALMLSTAYALTWPVPANTRITSPFGYRDHPILGRQQLHTGVDLAVPEGTSVRATAEGIVRRASEDQVNGRVIIIDHGHGVTTAYCHNSLLQVTVGQRVKEGDIIALSGTTGRSTGPHVHYQLAFGGKPVDPLSYR